MTKFKNKYRIESHRLKGWNYANNGLYFITLVTQNRICNLGYIENNEMILSDFGVIVNDEWYKSFEIRDELFLIEYMLMPNHLHAIVEIKNPDIAGKNGRTSRQEEKPQGISDPVQTNGRSSQRSQSSQRPQSSQRSQQSQQPKSISSFIGGFKSAVNSKIDDYIDDHQLNIPKYNRNNHFFQPDYHDHIIRNDRAFQNISNYIKNNPAKWDADTFNDENPNSDK